VASGEAGVDLREAARGLPREDGFPVKPGPFTLVYPKWIPRANAPNGPIGGRDGVSFFANGKEVSWRAKHGGFVCVECEVPAGEKRLKRRWIICCQRIGNAGVPQLRRK